MSNKSLPEHPDPGKTLDRQAEQLADRHQARLEVMTQAAVDEVKTAAGQPVWQQWPAMATGVAFSLALVTFLVFDNPVENPTLASATQQESLIPDWVRDDEVPVSLLENMDLYVWISQQPSEENQG